MQKLYSYMIWLIVTLFVVYAFCLNTATSVFFDAIKVSLNINELYASVATGSFILGFAFMQIPAGFLLDKYDAKYIVSLGILLLASGNFIISTSDHFIIFTLANFLQGIGASFAFVASVVLISQWFPLQQFPILFGLSQTLNCILTGIIHYFFTVALATYTWKNLYFGLSVFGFCLLVFAFLFIKNPSNLQKKNAISLHKSLLYVFKNKQILLCSVATATSFGVLLAYASFWYLKVQLYYSVENLEATMISSLIFVGLGLGTPLWGWLSNIVNSRLIIIHSTLVIGTMALLLGIYFPHYESNDLITVKIISLLIGFFLSGSMLFYTLVGETVPENIRGVAISVVNTTVFIFNTLLLFIPTLFVTERSKEFFTYLWVLPFCLMFSILIIYFIKEPQLIEKN